MCQRVFFFRCVQGLQNDTLILSRLEYYRFLSLFLPFIFLGAGAGTEGYCCRYAWRPLVAITCTHF